MRFCASDGPGLGTAWKFEDAPPAIDRSAFPFTVPPLLGCAGALVDLFREQFRLFEGGDPVVEVDEIVVGVVFNRDLRNTYTLACRAS